MLNRKSILSLFLVLTLLASCSGTESPSITPETPVELTSEPSISDIPLETAPPTNMFPEFREEVSVGYYTFAEAVEESGCAVIAEFVSYIPKEESAEYIFNVKEVLRGDVPENPIHVSQSYANAGVIGTGEGVMGGYSFMMGTDKYTVGKEYILLLRRHDSIFRDYPIYTHFAADIYLPADDTASGTMYGELISEQIDRDIITLIRETPLDKDEESRPSYTKSEDMAEIIEFSDVVMEVKIVEWLYEGRNNSTAFYCEVINVLKGPTPNNDGNGLVFLMLVRGSAEVGGHYLVMVDRLDETSAIHTQSSLKSVISMDDTEAVAEVRRILEWANYHNYP
jgi:hypothetical protein